MIANGNTVDFPVPVGPWTATMLGDKACIVVFHYIAGRPDGDAVLFCCGLSAEEVGSPLW